MQGFWELGPHISGVIIQPRAGGMTDAYLPGKTGIAEKELILQLERQQKKMQMSRKVS